MKLSDIFRSEFVAQAKRVRTWLFFAILFVAAYRLRGDGVNCLFTVAQETILTSLLWVFMAPVVAGSAAARDLQPLVSIPAISKADYLGGRFLAAFALNALILLAVPLGMLVAFLLSGGQPQIIGPYPPLAYLGSYSVLALPTAFTFTAVQFSAAALKGRAIASYFGTALFLVAVGALIALAAHVLQIPALATLLDPSVRIILVLIPETTVREMNTVLLGLKTPILANRLLWPALALALLAFTYRRFRFTDAP